MAESRLGVTSVGRALARPFRQTARDLRDPARSTAARIGIAAAAAFTLLAVFPALVAFYVLLQVPFAPTAAEIRREVAAQPSILLASDGAEIGQFQRAGRHWVPLDSVARPFIEALLATEDHRFFEHGGIDWRRSLAAAARTATGRVEGGSTLTQQLARNLYPDEIGRALSLRRKAREVITARRIERLHSKDEILEAYVNTVPFLYNAFGVEMAARTYFGKRAHELDVVEAATLVGMLRGAAYYNPVRNPERAVRRRNTVLMLMARRGFLAEDERRQLRERPLGLDFRPLDGPASDHPHFTRYVREWLSEWADRNRYDLFSDGLVIHTTLDRGLQRLAEEAVRRQGDALQRAADAEWGDGSGSPFGAFWARNPHFEERTIRASSLFREALARGMSEAAALDSIRGTPALRDSIRRLNSRLEIGFVGIEPRSGRALVWVGSRDFRRTPFDHVWQSRRQPGSAFKPFVYAAALQRGFLPGDTFIDEPRAFQVGRGQVWRPTNAGNRYTEAPMTLTEALAYSKNTVTAQLMMEVGPPYVASVARRAGIRESPLRPLPSLALGTSEVSLLELVSAFATLAASGRYHRPIPVTRVEDRHGRVLAQFTSPAEQVLPKDVAQTITHMLRGAIDHGTGRAIRHRFGIRADVAGKTGTSQRGADGWFVLMHPHLVAGAWVGFPKPALTWRTAAHGQASRNALPVVGTFFQQAVSQLPEARFPTPARYREPGSIWERARRWWDDRFGDDQRDVHARGSDYFRTDIPYDDLLEWVFQDDTLPARPGPDPLDDREPEPDPPAPPTHGQDPPRDREPRLPPARDAPEAAAEQLHERLDAEREAEPRGIRQHQ